VTKLHKDLIKTLLLTERTSLFGQILDNSRAIIQRCIGHLSWLSKVG